MTPPFSVGAGQDVTLDLGAGVAVDAPELCLWRAPTDNDGIKQGWMSGIGARGRWLFWGLDRLVVTERSVVRRRGGGAVTRTTQWQAAESMPLITHRQVIEPTVGGVRFTETVDIPAAFTDLPRVGVQFELPAGFEQLSWFGVGPGDSYADRRELTVAQWKTTVSDTYVDYVVPQEHGHHVDTRWFEVGRAQGPALRIAADRRFGFNASHFTVDDLTSATHNSELVPRTETVVHVDVAHRGLGTAACGPDTHPRHLVPGGRYRWQWTLGHAGE